MKILTSLPSSEFGLVSAHPLQTAKNPTSLSFPTESINFNHPVRPFSSQSLNLKFGEVFRGKTVKLSHGKHLTGRKIQIRLKWKEDRYNLLRNIDDNNSITLLVNVDSSRSGKFGGIYRITDKKDTIARLRGESELLTVVKLLNELHYLDGTDQEFFAQALFQTAKNQLGYNNQQIDDLEAKIRRDINEQFEFIPIRPRVWLGGELELVG